MESVVDLLMDLAKAGSFDRDKAAFWIPCEEIDALQELCWIKCVDTDFFVLTRKAAFYICPTLKYRKCKRLAHYTCPDVSDPTKLTILELIRCLHNAGWEEQACAARDLKKKAPVTDAGPWRWYSIEGKAPTRNYLQALLQSEKIFRSCATIHHGQLEKLLAQHQRR